MRASLVFFVLFFANLLPAQTAEFMKMKAEKLAVPSPFEKIVSGEEKAEIVYQDDYVVAFAPLRLQAAVHYLIVPRKRIPTLNDATDADAMILGHLLLAAKKLAKDHGVAESGYRIAINTNEDAGQSVFHLHIHLLGGMALGPMVPQTYRAKP